MRHTMRKKSHTLTAALLALFAFLASWNISTAQQDITPIDADTGITPAAGQQNFTPVEGPVVPPTPALTNPATQTAQVIGTNTGSMLSEKDIGLDSQGCSTEWFGANFDLKLCAAYVAGSMLYGVVWMVSWVLWVAGFIFDTVLQIQNSAFYDQALVNIGWKIARDVVNIFYILILLIIAIATIIQNSSYGMKQILWKVIVSALLVNFSLPLAGLVIDFSNALGNTFYTQMSTTATGERADISAAFVSAYEPQKFLQTKVGQGSFGNLFEHLLQLCLVMIFAILSILIISVMLIIASGMLIVRIVALWFVLILAPFAFLAWILPKTQDLANKWFTALFDNAFFYPAYMFTLYLYITAANSNAVQMMLKSANTSREGFWVETATLLINLTTFTLFALGGLMVAKSMSVQGAGIAAAGGKFMTNKGKAMGNRALYEGAYRPAGWASDKIASGAVGKAIARIPIVRRALRVPGAGVQKRDEERARQAEAQAARVKGLAPEAAANLMSTLNARGKAKAYETMDEKQRARVIQQMNKDQQIKFAKDIHGTDPNKDYARQVAIASGSVEQAMKILHGTEAGEPGSAKYQSNVDKYVKSLNEKDLAKLKAESVNDIHFQRAAITNGIDTEKLQNSLDIIDPEARAALENLTREIYSVKGGIKILTGLDEPEKPTAEPTAPVAPRPEDYKIPEAFAAKQQEYATAMVKHNADMAKYTTDTTGAKKKHDEYREEMAEYTAKYLPENKIGKVNKDTIRTSAAFQEIMAEQMNGNDIRRMAKDRAGAEAIREGFAQYAKSKGISEDLDKGGWDKLIKLMEHSNKDLARWMTNNSGAKSIIIQGRAASRRDLPTGTPAPSQTHIGGTGTT